MLSNYCTLFHISALLDRLYQRTVIAQVYSQEKNTLSILLYAPEPQTITISCNARENYIVGRPGDFRTQKNTIDLFPSVIDAHIQSVYLSTSDRIIYLKLSGNQWMCLEMFASKANVLLCDDQGIIVDAFLNKKDLIQSQKDIQKAKRDIGIKDILPERKFFLEMLTGKNDEHKHPVQILKTAVPKLGKIFAEEVFTKTGSPVHDITLSDAEIMYDQTEKLVSEVLALKTISPILYFEERSPVCLSLIPLDHLSSNRSEQYDDLFTGIQKFVSFERSTSSYLQKKKEIVSWLTKELQKADRTVRAVQSELAESSRSEQYSLYANLIMAHLPKIRKGIKKIEVENTFSDGSIINIPLDITLTPLQNAEKFFEKAKKSKSGIVESEERLVYLKQRVSLLNDVLEKSKQIKESFSLKNFLQSYGGMVKELGFMTEKEQEELPPFKIFAVLGGFTVFAGKNSANNDLLTFRYAKPNDLWFHARGSSGSHVVLKVGSAQGTPSKQAIEQAASIAAYYSKMKNAKHVPVAMTERKYIRKPKGAPAGTVALDKEKVIFVQPVLPEQ